MPKNRQKIDKNAKISIKTEYFDIFWRPATRRPGYPVKYFSNKTFAADTGFDNLVKYFTRKKRCLMNKTANCFLVSFLLVFAAVLSAHAIPNPAAAYAAKLGYEYSATEDGETVAVADGVVLDAWDFYRGKVGSEYAYGAQFGYDTVNRRVEADGFVQSYAVCVPKAPLKAGGAEEIPLLELMKQNGEPLWDDAMEATPAEIEAAMKTAPLKTFPKMELPSSWDWRNMGGASYIGSVRNQGSCGSCYAFGAAAAAEGTFNYAMGKTGSQCVDFSEAYIAWCLGEYGDYSSHFSGCDGADYDYAELEALTVEGICGENQMPYNNGSDPGSCTYGGTTTVFDAWARVTSGDIDAIKAAIMTYGVVDAAVYVGSAFDAYDDGVYDDSNNSCSSGWYTTSNHAISLVGWDDNPPEGGGGVWILRNSWGTSWGESGYMRLRYDAAVVHCAVCYMQYTPSSPTPPTFGANPGPLSATTGVAKVFTVTANGYPSPTLALKSTTASSGYNFTAGTGQLSYTAPLADVGSRTFTFTATNTAGAVTQVVSVTVYEAPPAAPASIWASATNTTDFTAAWSSVSGATGYRLDVGTNGSFSTGGGGAATNLLAEGFASASPSGWTLSGLGTYSSSPYVGTLLSGTYSLKFDGTGDYAITPTFASGATNLQFWAYGNGGAGSTFAISGLVNSVWTLVDTVVIAQNGATYNVALNPQTTQIGFYFTKSYNCALDDVIVQGGAGNPFYIAGYSNRTVASTSQSVTGLTAGMTYYFRARAVSGGGTSPNSSVANVTTYATLSVPVFGANPGPVATTAGLDTEFTVSASGVPAPTLALVETTAAVDSYDFDTGTGDLLYIAPQSDAGSRTFRFSAVNSQGTAYQTVTVNVAAATAPVFTGGAGPYSTTTGVEVAFTVTASGTAPALALQSSTASADNYDFDTGTGYFLYLPTAGEVGTQTFTFTAANAAGTVTQITSVVVSEAPSAPSAPASIWASATNMQQFTAAWSTASGAASYRLDVSESATFSSGGGGGSNLMTNPGFESGDSTAWTKFETEYSVVTTDPQEGTYHVSCAATGTRDLMQPVAITGDGVTEYEVSFWYKKPGSGNCRIWASWASGGQVSGDSLQPATYLPTASDWTKVTYTVVPNNGANTLNFEVRTYSGATVYWDNFFVGQAGGGSSPSFVPGYEDRTVAGTSQSVTGLTAGTTYYFRARAVNAVGTSGNSPTGSVTTLESAPPADPYEEWIAGQGENPEDPEFAPEEDADNDTVSNYDEYLADTDPTSPSSVFQGVGSAVLLNQSLTFPASTGRQYSLYYKLDLGDATWLPVVQDQQGTNTTMTLTDTNVRERVFYRLEAELLP